MDAPRRLLAQWAHKELMTRHVVLDPELAAKETGVKLTSVMRWFRCLLFVPMPLNRRTVFSWPWSALAHKTVVATEDQIDRAFALAAAERPAGFQERTPGAYDTQLTVHRKQVRVALTANPDANFKELIDIHLDAYAAEKGNPQVTDGYNSAEAEKAGTRTFHTRAPVQKGLL